MFHENPFDRDPYEARGATVPGLRSDRLDVSHPLLADRAEARRAFDREFPAFAMTAALDALRQREFSRLDREEHVYLDYTGASQYPESIVRRHLDLLVRDLLGNPHSLSPASARATDLVERTRAHVLRFFNASPEDYAVVFTANASHALRLVGESYPFEPGGRLLLTFDNHNSVNGLREFARARGAQTVYVPMTPPDLRCRAGVVEEALRRHARKAGGRLFAFPAQSNFSGVQHPLTWIRTAQDHGWHVLLDAAAFVPTNRLDLTRWSPDFVPLSFYKMFGYPTGVGALVARRDALATLRRPWFAGGTITVASVGADRHRLAPGPTAFEDGTVSYATIPALGPGLSLLDEVGIDTVHTRVTCLTAWLLDRLQAMRHSNGGQVVRLYGPGTVEARGATVAFNLLDGNHRVIDHEFVEARAARRRISLRTGCFCNPGAGELALGLSAEEIAACFARGGEDMTYTDFRRCVDPKSSGAVRISLGLGSTFDDAHAFVRFAGEFVE